MTSWATPKARERRQSGSSLTTQHGTRDWTSTLIMSFVLVPIVSSAWGSTYRFDEVIHSRSVTERLRQTEAASAEGQRVLFGEVIIKNNTAEVAWVAVGPSIIVLGINSQVGIDGPGTVGPVFGTARSGALRLIEFGAQGLVVSDGGNINGRVSWRCPYVTSAHRVCQNPPGKPSASLQELDRVLAFADRGKAYEDFEGFEFRGRFIDREHILPTQINKLGQVVFIDPLGQVPNAVFLATPLLFGKKQGLSMLDDAMPEICLAVVCLVSAIVLTSSCGGPTLGPNEEATLCSIYLRTSSVRPRSSLADQRARQRHTSPREQGICD